MSSSHTKAPMRALLAILIPSLSLAGCVTLGLSEPEFCNEQGSASLEPWIEKNWVPYCDALDEHLNSPQNYSLMELASFLAQHTERVSEINQKLSRYEKPERCYGEAVEELKYRRLMSCIEDNDEQNARFSNSFSVRADPWLDEYQLRVKKLRRDLNDAKELGERIMSKLQGHIDEASPMDDPELASQLSKKLETLDKDVKFIDGAKPALEALLYTASPHPALANTINNNYRPPLTVIIEDHAKNKKLYAELVKTSDYLTKAAYGVGKSCPDGVRARNEEKAAKPLLTEAMAQLSASKKIAITETGTVVNDPDGFISRETFKGFFCAQRRAENQVEGKPQVCSQHFFTIEREKGQDEKKWDVWNLKGITEGDATQGVDCSKL